MARGIRRLVSQPAPRSPRATDLFRDQAKTKVPAGAGVKLEKKITRPLTLKGDLAPFERGVRSVHGGLLALQSFSAAFPISHKTVKSNFSIPNSFLGSIQGRRPCRISSDTNVRKSRSNNRILKVVLIYWKTEPSANRLIGDGRPEKV